MAARSYKITVDLAGILQSSPIARAAIFSNLAGAVETVARTGVERWQAAAGVAKMWDGERRAYAAAIRFQMISQFEAVIINDYKYVEDIESGRPARDLKKMLDTSLKVRLSKKGVRYLVIPMRHNTPGHTAHAKAMPDSVYAEAKELKPSRIVGHVSRRSGTGAWDLKTKEPARVRQRKYVWGDRLGKGLAPKLQTKHKSDPYAGMVKMKADNPRGGGSSVYMTFRVMTEKSSGWIIAPQPGQWIARAVADSLKRTADIDFPAAVQRDLVA